MFTMPLHREILVTSFSDASTLNFKRRSNMKEVMSNNTREQKLSGSVGSLSDAASRGNSGESTPNRTYSGNTSHEGSPAGRRSSLKSSNGKLFNKSNRDSNVQVINDISPNHTQFYEVMYVGKIKISHKKTPPSFIDDALPKFKAYEALRLQKHLEEQMRRNSTSSDSGTESNRVHRDNNNVVASVSPASETLSSSPTQELKIVEDQDREEMEEQTNEWKDRILNTKLADGVVKSNSTSDQIHPNKRLLRGLSHSVLAVRRDKKVVMRPPQIITTPPTTPTSSSKDIDLIPKQRDRSASIGSIPMGEQNRTMVFLVGKSELRLISPDKKQVLLYKDFKDLISCIQGQVNSDHFGIICREENVDGYIGYIFTCHTPDITNDIVTAMVQSFNSAEKTAKEEHTNISCEHCPLLWYHKLCTDIDGLNEKRVQSTILKRIEMLADEDQDIIMAKYDGAEDMAEHTISEQNNFMMLMLKAHCESRQLRHVHDTVENRSEFLNQYLGGSTLFKKAKRSISSSFDQILKRKSSRDDFSHIGLVSEPTPSSLVNKQRGSTSEQKPRSNQGSRRNSDESTNGSKTSMMDIFIKVGNNPKEKHHVNSWRQEILSRVTSSQDLAETAIANSHIPGEHVKRTNEQLRELWRGAIRQIIILHRMEKENALLQARHTENEIRKIKLDYDEISPCDKQFVDMWDKIIDHDTRQVSRRDKTFLMQAIKNGVPRYKRGEVWIFLAEQFCVNTAPVDAKKFPNYNTPYGSLLKCLTDHQHAIFIDLGRTFPNHKYYKQSLGIGQLSLFNLLKAYSILDPELGYCQGLGFICGVLLLHLDEAEAFEMLKHLMFRRDMRTKYLPDMKKFQLQLYQISRLLKDYHPDLYDCFDQYEISPTLYAAPWILTVFSSQFPLGFVVRVFDLLFLESTEVIFKVAIALLELHKEKIMQYDSFEDIMEYLKEIVPKVDTATMDKIMKRVFHMDIARQMTEYQVEYNVLQEEITSQNYHIDNLKRSKEENLKLEQQLHVAQTTIQENERTRLMHQKQTQVFETQINSLEVTIDVLGSFILDLVETRHDIEFPSDVRQIIQQLCQIDIQKKPSKILERKIYKSKSVNSNLGQPLGAVKEMNEDRDPSLPKEAPRAKKVQNDSHLYKTMSLKSTARLDTSKLALKLPEHVQNFLVKLDGSQGEDFSFNPNPPLYEQNILLSPTEEEYKGDGHHPLSTVGDVNFRFDGTTQLKTIRTVHTRNNASPMRTTKADYDTTGRS